MRRARSAVVIGIAGVAGLGALAWGGQRWYTRPMADLAAQIADAQDELDRYEAEMFREREIRQRLGRFGATGLGTNAEAVSARLRTALNEIAASQQLANVAVTTQEARAVRSPAASSRTPGFRTAATREQADFSVMTATLRGAGPLPGVLRTLATLDAQAWVHRIDRWSIEPANRERTVFTLNASISSAYLTDARAGAAEPAGPLWVPASAEAELRVREILPRLAFLEPPPPPAPAAEEAPRPREARQRPAGPPAATLADWRVTAVVQGRNGPELWVTNGKSGQTLGLKPGEGVLNVVFVEIDGERAVVAEGESRFQVLLGQSLADKSALIR